MIRREVDQRAALVRGLRARFAEHNRLVFLVAVMTLFVAVALWYLLYAVLYWLAILAVSLAHGMDARPPEIFPAIFIYAAGLLLFITWIAKHNSPNDVPRDKISVFSVASDLVLAVPRATLAVWGNLSARQSLSEAELLAAAEFLRHLEEVRRLPVHSLPLDLPDAQARLRILLALQLAELIRVHHTDGVAWISIAPDLRRRLR